MVVLFAAVIANGKKKTAKQLPEMELIYKYKFRVALLHQTTSEKNVTKICYDEKKKEFYFLIK